MWSYITLSPLENSYLANSDPIVGSHLVNLRSINIVNSAVFPTDYSPIYINFTLYSGILNWREITKMNLLLNFNVFT